MQRSVYLKGMEGVDMHRQKSEDFVAGLGR